MFHLADIFTEKHVLVLAQYRPSGTFQLRMPNIVFIKVDKIRVIGLSLDKFIQIAFLTIKQVSTNSFHIQDAIRYPKVPRLTLGSKTEPKYQHVVIDGANNTPNDYM